MFLENKCRCQENFWILYAIIYVVDPINENDYT